MTGSYRVTATWRVNLWRHPNPWKESTNMARRWRCVERERDAEEERLGGDAQQRRHGQLISGSLKIGTQGCSLGTAGVSPRRPQPRSGRHTGGRPPLPGPMLQLRAAAAATRAVSLNLLLTSTRRGSQCTPRTRDTPRSFLEVEATDVRIVIITLPLEDPQKWCIAVMRLFYLRLPREGWLF